MACAIGTVALTVGTLYSPLLFTGYLLAGVALMMPLAEQKYFGCFLAYLGCGILTLLFNGGRFWDTTPYILFFGLHPLVNALQRKWKISKWIAYPIKALWFDGAMYLTWRFVFGMNTSIAFIDSYILPIILIGGTVFFFVYDRIIESAQRSVNAFLYQIRRKGGR